MDTNLPKRSEREQSAMSWLDISQNPICSEVQEYTLQSLRFVYGGAITDPDREIRNFVEDRFVLDIGVVEHDRSHINSPNWKHRKICKWARRCIGVDILSDEIAHLNEIGFDVRFVDATSDADLGERFERIVIGDVIEHVNDPVKLLQFCKKHLANDGKVLVSTPNPYWILFILESIRKGTYIANADHVRWVSPTMALELGRRAGLTLEKYMLSQPTGRSSYWKHLVSYVRSSFWPNAELFTHSFYYVYNLGK